MKAWNRESWPMHSGHLPKFTHSIKWLHVSSRTFIFTDSVFIISDQVLYVILYVLYYLTICHTNQPSPCCCEGPPRTVMYSLRTSVCSSVRAIINSSSLDITISSPSESVEKEIPEVSHRLTVPTTRCQKFLSLQKLLYLQACDISCHYVWTTM